MKEFVHMSKFEKTLFSGAEWTIKAPMWLLLQLSRGIAYLQSGQTKQELVLGGLAIVPPNSAVTILVSVLSEASLRGCAIKVSSLSGLLTPAERFCLEKEAPEECAPFRQLAAEHPLAERIGQWYQNGKSLNLPVRLGFMATFAEWLSPSLEKVASKKSDGTNVKPLTRLRQLMNQIPESELTELSLSEVANNLCCCERHASRLFREVCGCSFRKYISELRLTKACQMLAQGNYKIIDVALESGHSSLALFNYNFKNRFRMTPTEWRERNLPMEPRSTKSMVAALLLLAGWLALGLGGTQELTAHGSTVVFGAGMPASDAKA